MLSSRDAAACKGLAADQLAILSHRVATRRGVAKQPGCRRSRCPAPHDPIARPLSAPPAADNREEAERKFQEISQAYERLMTTDEDQKVEQLGM